MILKYIKRVFLLAFMLCLHLQLFAQKEVIIDRIIAKVDDYIVLQSELDQAYLELLSRGKLSGGNAKCQTLESLVVNKLMVAKAEIDSVLVTDEEVELSLDQRMAYFIQQIGSEEKLEEVYDKTVEEFRAELFDQIHEQLVVQKMQREVNSGIEVTPAEVKAYFESIPKDSLPFFSTEVTVGQIVKTPEVNENTKKEVKAKLADLRQRILDGERFESIAANYSMDPGSAAQGGELGFFSRGELAPEFEATALHLEPGEISNPVETQFGYHIIELLERRGNSYNSRHVLLIPQPTFGDKQNAVAYLDSLRTMIQLDSITFEAAAKEYSDDQMTNSNGGYFSDGTGALRVSVEELDPTMFFTIDTMKIGNITKADLFTQRDGNDAARIIYYKDRVAPHQANFLQDFQKIRAATLANKRGSKNNDWFDSAQSEVFIQIDADYDHCKILPNKRKT